MRLTKERSIFSVLMGTPPHRYLRRVRLRRAAETLRDGVGVGVTETCYAGGFASLGHFICVFKRNFGLSPSRYSAAPTPRVLN